MIKYFFKKTECQIRLPLENESPVFFFCAKNLNDVSEEEPVSTKTTNFYSVTSYRKIIIITSISAIKAKEALYFL